MFYCVELIILLTYSLGDFLFSFLLYKMTAISRVRKKETGDETSLKIRVTVLYDINYKTTKFTLRGRSLLAS